MILLLQVHSFDVLLEDVLHAKVLAAGVALVSLNLEVDHVQMHLEVVGATEVLLAEIAFRLLAKRDLSHA